MPFPLIAAGEQHVASSLAAIIIAAAPLIVALLAIRFDAPSASPARRLVGLLIGLGGVVALVGIDIAGRADELLGAGAILVAAGGYAAGPMVLSRTLADADPRATMGASLAIARRAPHAVRRRRAARGDALAPRRSARCSCSASSAPPARSSSSAA